MTTTSDPKASSRLFDIAALDNDGSNFPTWKYRVRTVLEVRGLMSIVNGTEARPVPTANDPKSSEITSWDTRDREAKAQITLTLKDEVRIGPGLPVLDYLDGEALDGNGGRPRHLVEAEGGYFNNGLGARLSAT